MLVLILTARQPDKSLRFIDAVPRDDALVIIQHLGEKYRRDTPFFEGEHRRGWVYVREG